MILTGNGCFALVLLVANFRSVFDSLMLAFIPMSASKAHNFYPAAEEQRRNHAVKKTPGNTLNVKRHNPSPKCVTHRIALTQTVLIEVVGLHLFRHRPELFH